ncbi:UDP-N-acetylmuramoyl-L-alanyl-D-glutamate--2,6-diaminopimelate ligase [Paenibacillus sp. J31TS4]|uniref:UDP-N-acetylmuramoyl-L-alanyl-D-glutamate--2, 6-diaminopimelate ligase n=1 Tax=Paenibacillus sp. J31TS4 TaxID=2807195 RepID=UPI001B017C03|nr:UDP-N-acetylmuramoyl-L-alanyl-D-glutamate--2,6-diaminopimelate ligase [Paenibacillus sp. J31TS4]GIP36989.1 UDP-N-acetylmuramoyl-L-alanyl-D-glutamate--2,6-diaminopimelate ligase [Paenibacillus sp. J31TS4]
MILKEAAKLIKTAVLRGDGETAFSGIQMHTAKLAPGDLFVCVPAIPGQLTDRHAYAGKAWEAGASALVVERELDVPLPQLVVKDARYAMAVIAAAFYRHPSRELKLIALTGTNGKTTTSYIIEAILGHAGYRTGLMGNIATKIGDTEWETDINTQEPPALQANLRRMADAGVQYCVMEATSQGLATGRVVGCSFRTAVFTNLTQDHLDFHGTMEDYRAAKGLLFSRLGNAELGGDDERRYAVLNADDEASAYMKRQTAAEVLTYGIRNPADVQASDMQLTPRGTRFRLTSFAGEAELTTKLVGAFNVENVLAAVTACLAENIPLSVIRDGLAAMPPVRGRMEVIDEGQDFLVLVDYAHTPDGLESALSSIRGFAEGRIITLFGCGGDRDRSKRPMMGRTAAAYSDCIVLTSDNPRLEDPEAILDGIEEGIRDAGWAEDRVERIADRREAIARAIRLAQPGDVVYLAGKGHETYQLIEGRKLELDDREEAQKVLRTLVQGGNSR